jgi:predicted amidohydrolase YtcJ
MIIQTMSRMSLFVLAAFSLCLAACNSESPEPMVEQQPAVEAADTVLVNGGIYTVNGDRDWAEAAAIRDGLFVLVGSNTDVEPMIGPATRIIDLNGKMALPGFHDAHVHPRMGGTALLGCGLDSADSVEAIIEIVEGCLAKDTGDWLEGFAFNLGFFGTDGPNKALLDAIDTDRPIVLWGADGHNAWVNSHALDRAGITAETPDPALGVIERDPDGEPSGTLRETAQELVRPAMPQPTMDSKVNALKAGVDHLNAFGITSWIDASVGLEDYQAYQALERSGDLTGRVVTSLTYESGFAHHYGEEFDEVLTNRHQYESEHVKNSAIKIFVDGVLEGETAAILDPYIGMQGNRGELILEPEELNAAVTRFDAMGMQVHMHAIGDRAVRAGLDAIEAAQKENGRLDNRHHISHLQMINVDDIDRFAALDAAANFQALWAYPDVYIMELNLPVLGEERIQGMYPLGSVERSGGRIVGGSDWDVSSANPLDAIETAVRRQDSLSGNGPVLNESERVSLSTMIDAYTINAAWLMHQEDTVGSIEVGKKADVVVLDRSLFDIPDTEISDARVLETLLDGETVYAAED